MINLEKILSVEPTLTPNGIEKTILDKKFDNTNLLEIEKCINWLKDKPISNRIGKSISSYGIKHIIERELGGYVANGSFIAAVIHLGIPYERVPKTPNICLAIKKKELYKNDPQELDMKAYQAWKYAAQHKLPLPVYPAHK